MEDLWWFKNKKPLRLIKILRVYFDLYRISVVWKGIELSSREEGLPARNTIMTTIESAFSRTLCLIRILNTFQIQRLCVFGKT